MSARCMSSPSVDCGSASSGGTPDVTFQAMTTTARIGISLLPGDNGIAPDELARAVEERGFESLWLPEHSHIPTSRDTPWPGSLSGEPLPEVYSRSARRDGRAGAWPPR